MFPHSQKDLVRSSTVVKVSGEPQTVQNLTLRLTSASLGAPAMTLQTDGSGEINDATVVALQALRGQPMLDQLSVEITAQDNPQLVKDGALDLSGIRDMLIFAEYGFTYR